mmetsp:Transcript_63514/g.160738  ORF Transcript_63514/g.160738 Transcript_63514/m.160738 type:complete len:203 (+) Transcript_63514:595-1203(+)
MAVRTPSRPFSVLAFVASKIFFSFPRNLSSTACDVASFDSSLCSMVISSFSDAALDAACSVLVCSVWTSSALSSFCSLVSPNSLSQKAFFAASLPASSSNFVIISVIRPRTFAKGSATPALRMVEAILVASCTRALDFCWCPRSRTSRTTLRFVKSMRDASFEATWTNETWARLAPSTLSLMIRFALASTFNSSSRSLVSVS